MNNTIIKKLAEIQQKLKAPKGQYNSFGKYKYRSCEDILEAVKPLLAKQELILTMNDEIIELGGRFYVKATVTLSSEDGSSFTTSAYAREDEVKKGMDGSQITGSCSSYARKYALGGLFAIDDTKDADTYTENLVEAPKLSSEDELQLKAAKEEFAAICKNHKLNGAQICKDFKIGRKPTIEQLTKLNSGLQELLKAAEENGEQNQIPENWRIA